MVHFVAPTGKRPLYQCHYGSYQNYTKNVSYIIITLNLGEYKALKSVLVMPTVGLLPHESEGPAPRAFKYQTLTWVAMTII